MRSQVHDDVPPPPVSHHALPELPALGDLLNQPGDLFDWGEFERMGYEERIALFNQVIDGAAELDPDIVYELVSALFGESTNPAERARFDALVVDLRRRFPDVYAHDAHYYLQMLISNAFAEGRLDDIPDLAKDVAATVGRDFDTFHLVLDSLAYHGMQSAMLDAMRIAWPLVQQSDVFQSAIDEFAGAAADLVIFEHLDRGGAPDPDDPQLAEQIGFFLSFDRERLGQYLAHLTGQAGIDWRLANLTARPRQKSGAAGDRDRAGLTDLYFLTVEFLGYLRREVNVPFSKGELARTEIKSYLDKRLAARSQPRQSKAAQIRAEKEAQKGGQETNLRYLCPTKETLDSHVADLLYFINPQYHDAAAILELMPEWLRFLELRGLIDAQTRAAAIEELRPFIHEATPIWPKFNDASLGVNIERAWANAAGSPLS